MFSSNMASSPCKHLINTPSKVKTSFGANQRRNGDLDLSNEESKELQGRYPNAKSRGLSSKLQSEYSTQLISLSQWQSLERKKLYAPEQLQNESP